LEFVESEAAWAGSVECRPERKVAWRPLVRVGLLEFSWFWVLWVFTTQRRLMAVATAIPPSLISILKA
jgi:hypothetical protein